MGAAERFNALPQDIQEEVLQFMDYLLAKRERQEAMKVDDSLDAVLAFKGAGAELWKDVDPDAYIAELRADW
jgi:hypothetical protein